MKWYKRLCRPAVFWPVVVLGFALFAFNLIVAHNIENGNISPPNPLYRFVEHHPFAIIVTALSLMAIGLFLTISYEMGINLKPRK